MAHIFEYFAGAIEMKNHFQKRKYDWTMTKGTKTMVKVYIFYSLSLSCVQFLFLLQYSRDSNFFVADLDVEQLGL